MRAFSTFLTGEKLKPFLPPQAAKKPGPGAVSPAKRNNDQTISPNSAQVLLSVILAST